MTHSISPRRQLFNNISNCIPPARESLKLPPSARDTSRKVEQAFKALFDSIKTFVRYSPRAYSDIAGGIGITQDLLLDGIARLKGEEYPCQQLKDWEKQLGSWRLSRAGQTHPNWLQKSAIGTGVLLSWKAPSLDGDDQGNSSEDEILPEKEYGSHCRCEESPPSLSPAPDHEAIALEKERELDFQD